MFRPSRINPKLSAYNQVCGNFDYSKTSLAPPGCKVVVHKSSEHREHFSAHGKVGYFTNRVKQHYQTYKAYIPETGGMRKVAIVKFFPKYVQMPKTSSVDRLVAIIEALTHILKIFIQNSHSSNNERQQMTPLKN